MTILIPLGGGGAIVEARFVARPNRFLVHAELDGEIVAAHLADRGRLLSTLVPDARLLLAHRPGPGRATAWQAVAAIHDEDGVERLSSLDTHLPNRLVEAALRVQALEPFAMYPDIRREVLHGASRFDFALSGPAGTLLLEVKSAGGWQNGTALFPDAPTTRGARHLVELAELAAQGHATAVLFVAQSAAQRVAVDQTIDPGFAQALRGAHAAGVAVYAYRCPLSRVGITLGPAIPVQLSIATEQIIGGTLDVTIPAGPQAGVTHERPSDGRRNAATAGV